jgi:CBS domain-containing protein
VAIETSPSPLCCTVAHEAMSRGIVTVSGDASLREVAATMAVRRVHAVLVRDRDDEAPTAGAAVRDLDVVRAALLGDPELPIAHVPAERLPVVDPQARLQDVAGVMVHRDAPHVLVVEEPSASPAGVLSTFDLVAVIAGRDPQVARAVRQGPAATADAEGTLDDVAVREAMHAGIIECSASTSLISVAAMLAEHGVHAVAVSGVERSVAGAEPRVPAVVEAMDVLAGACHWASARTAGELAGARPVAVSEDDSVESAARMMSTQGITHLVVVDRDRAPTGMLSALDVASVCARLVP